MIYSLINDYEM